MEERRFDTGLYIIDRDYRMISFNKALSAMYPEVRLGDVCYKVLARQDAPCQVCPLREDNVLFFNHVRREWIYANASEMDYPGHGTCYNIQFQRKASIGGTKREYIRLEKVEEHIAELQAATGRECALGAYFEPGSPLLFANEQMLALLGYETIEEMISSLDGLVVNAIHPEDRKRAGRDIRVMEKPGDLFETTFRIIKKDNSWVWCVAKGKMIETVSGRLATICVCSDMSEFLRRHEELQVQNRELRQKEAAAESIMLKIPGGYHQCGMQEGFPFLYISDSFEKVVGWTQQEIRQEFDNKFINLIWPEDMHLFDGLVEQIEQGGQGNVIYRMKQKGGGYIWVQDSTMFVDMGEYSFYQCTLADITSYIEELKDAQFQAEASNRAKSTFLFNASHDIRTPMNAIQGFANIIRQNPADAELVEETIEKILKSSDTLMKLLNDVLELARIESGKDAVEVSAADLRDYMDRMFTMFRQEIESAGIRFAAEEKIRDAHVLCDELKLTRIGMNLISNAKKFTSAGGRIVCGVEQLTDVTDGKADYRFYVKDTGIGMSHAFQERAFEQFERERTSTDSGILGSGLGLAIIKRLVDLMGGQCIISSELGKGTEMSVILTLQVSEPVQKAVPADCPCRNYDFSGKRLLLVEDNEFNRELAHYVLENMGFAVDEAENGAVAVNMLLEAGAGCYDLVLMDIQMPVMDGYTATQEIRSMADERLAQIPIIAMTANAFKEDQERCLATGMNAHISKPIDVQVVAETICRIVG